MNRKIYENLDKSLTKTIMELWTDIRESVFKENESLAEFKNTKPDELSDYHYGLGLYLRNNILIPDSEIYLKFIENGILQRDDMSSAMLILWHTALQKNN